MKRLMVLLVLLGLTLVVIVGGSMNGQLTPQGSVAAAEESERSLSVYGVGSATAPANALSLQLVVEHWDDYGPGGSMDVREKLAPVIEAVLAAGFDEDAISVPSSISAQHLIRLTVEMDSPSQEQVQALFEELAQTPRMKDMYLVHVGAFYEYDDRESLESEAYSAALEDAGNRARILANSVDASVVRIVDVADDTRTAQPDLQQSSSCEAPAIATQTDYYSSFVSGGYSTIDPDQEIEVRVVRIVQVTYTME